jgi:4-hydroxy-tetrahydrodipicolinate synthase
MVSRVNPIPVKAALDLLGICSSRARLPIVEASEKEREEIRQVLERQGLMAGSAA